MRLGLQPGNIITILVGLLFVGAGIYAYTFMGRSLATAREASGVVVELVYESGTRKGRIHPVVRFKTDEGQEFIGRSQQHSNVQVGQTVKFVYDPKRPDDIEIVTLERVKNRRVVILAPPPAVRPFGPRARHRARRGNAAVAVGQSAPLGYEPGTMPGSSV